MSAGRPHLSIVIPAFQEAARIGRTLKRVLSWAAARAAPTEVLVVDDGSSDETPEIVASFATHGVRLIRLRQNRGKGAALRAGVAATEGELVLLSDADLSTPIEEINRLEEGLAEADLVLGSRALSESRITVRQPLRRELAGKLFNFVIRTLGVCDVRDTQCGFKLLRGEVARRLFAELTIDGFAFDVELVWLAQRRGYRLLEVGVEWRNDPSSRVRVVRDGLRMMVDVTGLRLRGRSEGRRAGHGAEGGASG